MTLIDSPATQWTDNTHSALEERAEQLVGENELTMRYADPKSELFLAALARVVTLLVSARAYTPDTSVRKLVDNMDASSMCVEELLEMRQQKI
jgi:hypothetical protein